MFDADNKKMILFGSNTAKCSSQLKQGCEMTSVMSESRNKKFQIDQSYRNTQGEFADMRLAMAPDTNYRPFL